MFHRQIPPARMNEKLEVALIKPVMSTRHNDLFGSNSHITEFTGQSGLSVGKAAEHEVATNDNLQAERRHNHTFFAQSIGGESSGANNDTARALTKGLTAQGKEGGHMTVISPWS